MPQNLRAKYISIIMIRVHVKTDGWKSFESGNGRNKTNGLRSWKYEKAPVVIKGNKSGIRIVLDDVLPFPEILEEVEKNSRKVRIFLARLRLPFPLTEEN